MPDNRDSISLDNGSYEPDRYDPDPDDYDENPASVADRHTGRVDDVDQRGTDRLKQLGAGRSRIPDHAPRPMDHQPKKKKRKRDKPRSAAEREALGIETVSVEFDGETYVIPADPLDWELPTTEAFEQGKAITAIRGLFGPQQYRQLMSKGYRNRQFQELFNLLAEAGGFEIAGN